MFSSGSNSTPLQHSVSEFCPTLHPSLRQDIAFLALGNKASKTIEFNSALCEGMKPVSVTENIATTNTSDFTGTSWDVIRAGALDDTIENGTEEMILDSSQKADLISKIDSLAQSLKNHLDSNDPQLIPGIKKFLERFNAMKSTGRLASARLRLAVETKEERRARLENDADTKRLRLAMETDAERKTSLEKMVARSYRTAHVSPD